MMLFLLYDTTGRAPLALPKLRKWARQEKGEALCSKTGVLVRGVS